MEDLAREVADLRQENGWLKEIVMLKRSTLGSLNFGYDFSEGAPRPLPGQRIHDSQEHLSDESSRETKAVEKSKGQPRE